MIIERFQIRLQGRHLQHLKHPSTMHNDDHNMPDVIGHLQSQDFGNSDRRLKGLRTEGRGQGNGSVFKAFGT